MHEALHTLEEHREVRQAQIWPTAQIKLIPSAAANPLPGSALSSSTTYLVA